MSAAGSRTRSGSQRNPATENGIVNTSIRHQGLTCRGTSCKLRQFGLRCGEPRPTAIQADQDLWEYQKARVIDILAAAEMDVYLGSKFRLIVRRTHSTTHKETPAAQVLRRHSSSVCSKLHISAKYPRRAGALGAKVRIVAGGRPNLLYSCRTTSRSELWTFNPPL